MHKDLRTDGSSREKNTEHHDWVWHTHSFADSFQHALVMLILEKSLKDMVGGHNDAAWVNTETTADNFEGVRTIRIGGLLEHGDCGLFHRIGDFPQPAGCHLFIVD